MNQALSLAVLVELYLLAQADLPARVDVIARALHSDALSIAGALLRLEARGLVDAGGCRLTMIGLVVASSSAARRRAEPHAA
ncbi:MAG: hypothetical protein GXP55_07925 [Deltaproteobacteria bacterium]|nr:hypothetical protein [Deltaproteobacteria bacterium]